jgi:hypothetical protein
LQLLWIVPNFLVVLLVIEPDPFQARVAAALRQGDPIGDTLTVIIERIGCGRVTILQ